MKKLLNTLSIVVCILGISLNAQTNKTARSQSNGQLQVDPANSKATFINNQDYLSPNSLKDYRNFYGDSLKGFDEAAVKAELLEHLFFGQEFISVMNFRKRDYIDQKYKLGNYAPKPAAAPAPAQGSNARHVGGGATINVFPCVNEDFESTTAGAYNNVANPVSGWTVESTTSLGHQLACNTPTNPGWIAGSPEFSIMATPILGHPYIGTIPNSPLGGNNVALLNNTIPGFTVTRISTTFPVTTANTLFQFAYAGSWDGTGHLCCDQPFFEINMFDCSGAPLGCSSISLTPGGPSCPTGTQGYSTSTGGISWTNWQVKYIDLTPYVGSCVTLRVTNGDCDGGAHHGSLYFDARCGGSLMCSNCSPPSTGSTVINGPVSFCAGSGIAQIAAPTGYATYSWVAPPGSPTISAAQSTAQVLSVPNPVSGAAYTVYLMSPSGCQFIAIDTIKTTSVSIMGVATASSCAGGASGSATVVGHGSAAGYNYTWTSVSTNSVVGTASVATGLAAGVYSIYITGLGSAGCGSAVTTVTVGTAPPGAINIFKPFCGSAAYIVTGGGSNYQWYNQLLSPIAGSLGGNSPSITVNNPNSGDVITLTYTSSANCRDSVRYTLGATTPGFLSATNISSVCVNSSNGTASVNMSPASGAPPGFNYISVTSTGTSTPTYSANAVGNATALPLSGLSAGNYTVNAFDGSCYYTTNFSVHTFTFSSSVIPAISPTLCPGSSIPAGLAFSIPPAPGQYNYSWSTGTWLVGGNTTYSSTIITPVVAVGSQSTIVYSIVITPTIINCPVTQTLAVTAVNPPIPTITAIPNLCNTSPLYTIMVSPTGGSFSTAFSGPASPISQLGGILNPASTNLSTGTNTFVYSISVLNCPASQNGSFQISHFQSSALTSSVPPLCVTNPAFNLMNIVQSSVGNWSGTAGVSANHFNPAGLQTGNYAITYSTPSTPNPSVCPSYTTISVAVTNTQVPLITPIPEFCTNAAPFSMTVSPAGGGWSASTGVNLTGQVTPNSINIPNLPVTYTVAVGPCLDIATTTLHVSQFISASLTGTVNNLCYNSNPVNLLTIVQNTVGNWSGPFGSVSNNSFTPNGLATGVYNVTYNVSSTPNPTLCADQRTIAIYVSNPPAPTITQVGPYCNNASSVQLSVTPASGYWTTTSYLNNAGVFVPSLAAVGNNAVQYVIGTNSCNRQQTKFISVEAFVPATIVSAIPDLCNNSPILNLSPHTLNTQGSWSGPGISGFNFNPAITGAGQFVLTYTTASSPSGLCPDAASIAVHVYSLAAPVISQIGPFCNSNMPVELQVSPVGGYFGGPVPGAVSLSGLFNPGNAIIGDNIITYSITSGPCAAFAQTIVKVEKMISADFLGYISPLCKTSDPVNLNSYAQNPGGEWYTYQNSPGLMGNMFYPSLANIGNNNLVIHQTESATKGLCTDTAEIRIEVRDIPVVKIENSTTINSGCAPFEVIYHTPSVNSGIGVWTINDGTQPVTGLSVDHIFTTAGTYNIQFNYTDDAGCKALAKTDVVNVYASPKADFTVPDEIYISDPEIQLTNTSTNLNGNTYQWQIANLLQSSELSPMVVFPKIGKYDIMLTATTLHNCTDQVTKTIEVKNNFNIFIPNSFTPNFDGLNDYFAPVFTQEGIDLKSFDMEIFDRWGHSIYHTRDITKGWDGSVQNKGEPLKEDTYVYKIKYKDAAGNSYEKMGNVSLLK